MKQNKPENEKDYFDEIEEVGDSKFGGFRPNGDQRHERTTPYDPVRSDESEGDLSELSDAETGKTVLRFVTTTVKEPKIKLPDETPDEDDDYYGSSLQRNRRNFSTRVPDDSDLQKNDKLNTFPSSVDGVKIVNKSTLANSIRLKVSQVSSAFPTVFRRKNTTDYKIQIFVSFMFLTIILLVGSIYIIHQEKELQKAYFDRIRFSGKDRRIRVSNLKGREVLTGVLGTSLSVKDKAWECLDEDRGDAGTCLEWMNIARLYFRVTNPRRDWEPGNYNMQCYEILWRSLSHDFVPKDCFHVGETKGFYFYGGGELNSNQWPINRTSVPFSPFITGGKVGGSVSGQGFEWGRILRRFFVGSPGVAIEIYRGTPLHLSINDRDYPGMMCFAARKDDFAYPDYEGPNILNYTFCTGENIRDVFTQLADKEIWDGLTHEDVHMAHAIAASPIWNILPETLQFGNMTEASLLNHTDLIASPHLSEGYILLDETWQKHMGDLEMDPKRFQNMEETVNITRRRGFKIALTIQPYFATESLNYIKGLEKNLWVTQKLPGSKNRLVPALTSYKKTSSAVLLDITKKVARVWIQRKLHELIRKYGVDALFIDFGSTQDFPQHYNFGEILSSPDEYKEIFMKSIKSLGRVVAIGTTSATKSPKLPTFVSMSPSASTWESLQSVIPNILSMGVAGFPFISPGVIGGDFLVKPDSDIENIEYLTNGFNAVSAESAALRKLEVTGKPMPDRELYIRWLELVHFLPVVSYTYLPSEYDAQVVQLAQELKNIRKDKLYRYIKIAINDALTTGLPIIRPLWMSEPTDINCLKVSDEFTIGGYILVAPILMPNVTEREIYLPRGKWRDEMDGSSTKGERWIHHYKLKLNKIAYFTKLEDPT